MLRNIAIASALLMIGAAAPASQQQRRPMVEVYKTATCGCCGLWAGHLEANGFTVRTTNLENLADVKTKYRIPPRAHSCHTAVVNGYVVEGHVPAADVHRLLKERPAIAGIAVPGMPIGSPGMEVPGQKPQPFDVLAFDRDGQVRVFASHNK